MHVRAQLVYLAWLVTIALWPLGSPAAGAQTQPASASPHVGHGQVYLVPLGELPQAWVQDLQAHYQQTLGLRVEVLAPLAVDPQAVNLERGQIVAEEMIASMQRGYPQLAGDAQAILIGLTTRDLQIRSRPDWAWGFALRSEARFAVISTARMDNAFWGLPADDDWRQERLRKYVTRMIGFLHYRLPASRDPRSVLYADVLSVEDLDRMTEAFEPTPEILATPMRMVPTMTLPPETISAASPEDDEPMDWTALQRTAGVAGVVLLGLVVIGAVGIAMIELWERAE